jgi:DNA-binding response OmpR family regulator
VNHTQTHDPAKILVVDDSAFEQLALRDILAGQGFRVGSATDGRQGYDLATLTHPDLILLDVLMAGMDGFAVCRLLKANSATASIPVIFLTGAQSESERIEGLNLGAVDFIGKPFSAGELLARINIHLRLARPQQEDAAEQPAESADSGADEVLAAAAQRYIDHNLAEPLHLDDLAKRVGSYREKLSRAFLARRGMTVFSYIRDQRIASGAAMLRDSDAGIAEISLAVGFSNAGNFATAFRERMGVTPGAYRKGERASACTRKA